MQRLGKNVNSVVLSVRLLSNKLRLSFSDSSPAKNVTVHSWIGRMVMVSSENSDIFNQTSNEVAVENSVLPGHIALSKELLHVLGAGDLSIVKLQGISHGPLEIKGIILHPFGDTVRIKLCYSV